MPFKRTHPLILKAIREIYTPKVLSNPKEMERLQKAWDKTQDPVEQAELEAEITGLWVDDPDVLWVGPFMEGILTLMPEVFDGPSRPTRQDGRRGLKLFLMDITGRHARQLSGAQLTMRRARWEPLLHGEPLYLPGEKILDEEPGQILNSVAVLRNKTTGQLEVMNNTLKVPVPMAPVIQTDPRYGLHYLLRGDTFEFRWVTRFPRRQEFVARFVLKAPSEGSSMIVPEEGTGVHTF